MKTLPSISACIITNNDRRVLDAIRSVKKFCNEIILVETSGRNDFTNELNDLDVKLFYKDWNNDFSEARNYSIIKATGDYIFIIDSDEIFQGEINNLSSEYDFLLMRINYNDTYHWSVRLFKNYRNIFYKGKLHEGVDDAIKNLTGAKTDLDIIHNGYKDNEELKEKTIRNEKILLQDKENPYYDFFISRHYFTVCEYDKVIEHGKKAMNSNLSIENKAALLNLMYQAYLNLGNNQIGINLLIESLKLVPLQITARFLIVNYLLTQKESDRNKEFILSELKKIKNISHYKNSDLPTDIYFSENLINQKIQEIQKCQ